MKDVNMTNSLKTIVKASVTVTVIFLFASCDRGRHMPMPAKKEDIQPAAEGGGYASVKPLFDKYCINCHRQRNGPDISTYDLAKQKAPRIAANVASHTMPKPESEEAKTITPTERDTIIAWVKAGAPKTADQALPEGSPPSIEEPGPETVFGVLENRCAACHGLYGKNHSQEIPNLNLLSHTYISQQLLNFKSGNRKNETMQSVVDSFDEDQLLSIAAAMASYKALSEVSPELVEESTDQDAPVEVVQWGDASAGEQKYSLCAGCHGPGGLSSNPDYPSLAGQKATYIFNQLKAFQSGDRNNPIMLSMTSSLTEEEMKNVATYLSQQPPTNR